MLDMPDDIEAGMATGGGSNIGKKISSAAKGVASDVGGGSKSSSGSGRSARSDVSYNQNVDVPSYKHGGRVKRTGMAKVHRGERVLNSKQTRKYDRKRGRK
jgi:hypothetical protein